MIKRGHLIKCILKTNSLKYFIVQPDINVEQPIRSFVSQLGRGLLGILFASRWKGGTFHSSNGISYEKPHRIPVTKLQVHRVFFSLQFVFVLSI